MAKSCIHTVWPLENDQNVPYLSPLLLVSSVRKIQRKHRNSVVHSVAVYETRANNSNLIITRQTACKHVETGLLPSWRT